ncbi:transcriptional regulator, TetR family [Frankia torreyi]|uniref:Transcriptional regulator, TetR family n=1 Tax=Frankia torreyi TaxID=1856 RepID=A0A0D8B9Q4_9ACTN|nr:MULTISPECIES: TetR/AcrR family transcriptional regulator [Frankia]KJE20911.1 transcriptional regulator, TetR family [Frankia torreyi]KQM07772.1 transcriptional regulator, TetR family [Frankia sp. CpI1-P]
MSTHLTGPEDLTAKARIRAAAFALVAERGVHSTTVRAIAQRAGVSPALVIHHFGSKQGVIDAISTWIVEYLHRNTREPDRGGDPAQALQRRLVRFERMVAEVPLLGAYVRRMLLDGQPDGLDWFRRAVDLSAEELAHRERLGKARPSTDLRAEAAMLFILGFAPVLLGPMLEHALGLDFDDERSWTRWRDAESELLTSALYPGAATTGTS